MDKSCCVSKDSKAPPFLALCKLASEENWCWKITCTTCGHMHFRYGFKELINGKHPNDLNWVVNREMHITKPELGRLPTLGGFSKLEQDKLLPFVGEPPIGQIKEVSKAPDWLGYLGLVLVYCGSNKKQLSGIWASQFLEMLPVGSSAHKAFSQIDEGLKTVSLTDLELAEMSLYGRIS